MLEALLYAAIHWWPAFSENMGALKAMAAPLPMLKDQITLVDKLGAPAYVVGQHYFKACNILGTNAAVLFAANAIAGEAHRGTLEVWLARPVSRLRLYSERFVMGMGAIFLAVLASSLTTPPLLRTVGARMHAWDLTLCSVYQTVFLGTFFAFTYALSARSGQPIKIAFFLLFFAIAQFAIYMVKTITHYSVFRWADIETFARIVATDTLPWTRVGVMLALQAVFFGIGYHWFRHRTP
ncbi:MAG: ABC transporter permease subunit [Planctomycetota bacterium]